MTVQIVGWIGPHTVACTGQIVCGPMIVGGMHTVAGGQLVPCGPNVGGSTAAACGVAASAGGQPQIVTGEVHVGMPAHVGVKMVKVPPPPGGGHPQIVSGEMHVGAPTHVGVNVMSPPAAGAAAAKAWTPPPPPPGHGGHCVMFGQTVGGHCVSGSVGNGWSHGAQIVWIGGQCV